MDWHVALGIIFVALGVVGLVDALLLKRDAVKPGRFWGRSASEVFWQAIGALAWGLGMLSHLVVSENAATVLYIIGVIVFIVTLWVARKKAARN